ncbi:hypothetical protein OHAE_5138 [Ochrobactrum soli]|uniref:Uncharacterized protein n=1 Tax=Ochrobactrum soli TaxID=2448455 RepID=A0A2P9HEL1_9HYPH|nr:hypothetical protein OHAE_5138 [[Ochrobactrum] soli]
MTRRNQNHPTSRRKTDQNARNRNQTKEIRNIPPKAEPG